ncbi:MAG: TIGR02556 family CRISPR-associated protein [Bacillota bacterium]
MVPLLEAVALIGRTLAGSDDPLADLVKPVKKPPKAESSYLIKLDFRMSGAKPALGVDLQEIDDTVCVGYRWVGNAVGNRPQIYLTTDRLEYLVGQAPINLLRVLEEAGLAGSRLHHRLVTIVRAFFSRLPDGSMVLDPKRLGVTAEDVVTAAWQESAGKPRERAKTANAAAAEAVKKWALRELALKASQAALWTVLYDGEPVVADTDYAAVVLQSKEAALAAGSEEGVCSICGAGGRPVTWDFAQLDFLKYYITDKIGAASGVAETGFAHNFLACADCFRGLLLAEKYVRHHLNLSAGPLSFLVLPAFLREPGLARADLEAWADRLMARVGALANVSRWIEGLAGHRGLEEELRDLIEEIPYENVALLNFLFYRKSKSEFRVLSLVKDVAPSRIAQLLRHSYELANRATVLLGPDRWWLDLTNIYHLIPLHKDARGVELKEYKKLLHIYSGLLTGAPLDRAFLIRQFVALAKVYHTGNYTGTNVPLPKTGSEEWEWTRRLMQANLFLRFLREENLLRGGIPLIEARETEGLPEEMRAYLAAMAYSGPETALFLLGYLLNQVGRAQAADGYEHKPVLEKVNYGGMHWAKVVRLSNILVDQLRQHNILRYNEGLFAVMKKLFDAHRRNWPLSPEENVFYILSGYAYATRAALKAWTEKQNETEGGNT